MIGKEYIRNVENSRTAVLCIHGIIGTPLQFEKMIPLMPKTFSVRNLVLDGHGKGVRDFSRTSMRRWEQQVQEAMEALCTTHENVIVVGHSMGTLLGIDLALKYPEKVKLLFLLNVPLTPRVKPEALRHSYRVLFECVREDRADEVAAHRAYGIDIDRRLWLYIGWIPRFLELFKKAWDTRGNLSDISARCLAFQSGRDELVSNRSEKILRQHEGITTKTMAKSTHYLYDNDDENEMLRDFKRECHKFI